MIENKSMKICHQSIKWGIVAVLILLGLSSCSQMYNLKSETGLYDVKLVHTLKSGVDGVWSWGKGNPYVDQKEGKIFIAELKVDLIKDKYPRGANFMVRRMRRYGYREFSSPETLAASGIHCGRIFQPRAGSEQCGHALFAR